MEPNVILVNDKDQALGKMSKLAAHQQGLLHRAFSIFIIRKSEQGYETLLQQRALTKYHSGGLWTNSCCSHPHDESSLILQANIRLQEEFGLDISLTDIGQFIYRAELDHDLIEHEFDHVLIGFDKGETPKPNPAEIMNWRWCELSLLAKELKSNSQQYTAWIAPALAIVEQYILINHTTT